MRTNFIHILIIGIAMNVICAYVTMNRKDMIESTLNLITNKQHHIIHNQYKTHNTHTIRENTRLQTVKKRTASLKYNPVKTRI